MTSLLFILIGVFATLDSSLGLPQCSDPWQEFKGYTYSVDPVTKEKVWSHCKFPNPTADQLRCGMAATSGPAYICDPDGMLKASNSSIQINNLLISIQQNTSTLCTSSQQQRQSYIVAVALVDRIRIADLQDTNSCINNCNEVQPTLNTTSRAPTDEEANTMMANFANSLRASWQLGACDNDVIIFYNKELNKVYTSVGAKASARLPGSTLTSLESRFLQYVNDGKIDEGLLLFVEEIRTSLRSFTPAHILLVINMVIVGALVLFFIFFLHLSSVELDVWGPEKHWYVIDIVIKVITGVWFLGGLFYVISHILDKVRIWMAAICIIAAAFCLAIYFQEDKIFPNRYFRETVNFTG